MSERSIRVVDGDGSMDALIEAVASVPRIGLDTEANSFFAYYERVCLVQIATDAADYLVDPFAVDVSRLAPLLADPEREVVLHAAEQDVAFLRKDFGLRIARLFDTQAAAMLLGAGQVGYAALVEQHFGVSLPKDARMTDWGRRPLTEAQVAYAALDARWLVPLRNRLTEALEGRGRIEEARESFARLAASEARERVFDPDGYRRLKGFRDLDAAGRAVARALFLAREARAERIDRPPFRVLGNEALIRIAEARPRTRDALDRVRGVPRPTRQRWADGILKAVREGEADPSPPPANGRARNGEAERTRGRLDPMGEARFERLRAWRKRVAEARGITVQLVARNAVLKRIAERGPANLDELGRVEGVDRFTIARYGEEMLAALGATEAAG